jgi:hypothetical protein
VLLYTVLKHSECFETEYYTMKDTLQVPQFKDEVHAFFCDREFAPHVFRKVLLSLSAEDNTNREPIIHVAAMGHRLKNMCVSLHTVCSSMFIPLFEAQGHGINAITYKRDGIETIRRSFLGNTS